MRRLLLELLEHREVPALVTTALDIDDADRPNGDFIGSDGKLSLREAIELVNVEGGEITFEAPSTISLNDPLPDLTQATSIVGALAADGKPGTIIEGGFFNGWVFGAGGSVANLVVHGFGTSGLIFNGRGTVDHCFIGTDATGSLAVPNGETGVVLNKGGAVRNSVISGNSGAGLVIGGRTIIENNFIGTSFDGSADLGNGAEGVILRGTLSIVRNNVISGNDSAGVWIDGALARSNRVLGNTIGLAADGSAPLANTFGVYISNGARTNTIGGVTTAARNVISGNSDDGVRLELAGGSNKLQGNFIGVDSTGELPRPNGGDGVEILESSANRVGGPAAGSRNVIAGNAGAGVRIIGFAGVPANNNTVAGNWIGLNASGNDLGHPLGGVVLERFATNNTIGGTATGARNVISGNETAGVWITDAGTSGNKLQGNFIGTDATGQTAKPNEAGVVIIAGASNNRVGGATASSRNVISGNSTIGVLIADLETFENKVQGNRIGTDATGLIPLANVEDGIRIQQSVRNVIGGTTAGARNLISGNGDDGIEIIGNPFISEQHLNVVIGNYIGTNALGLTALANADDGVSIVNGRADRVGGPLAGERNIISGNTAIGVHLEGDSTDNRIEGNAIGTNAPRRLALPNAIGVKIEGTGAGNRVGGTVARSGNTVAGNTGDGIAIVGTRVDVFRNRIGLDPRGKPIGNGGSGVSIVNSNNNTVGGGSNFNIIHFNAADGVEIDGGTGNRISANRISDNGGLGIHLVNGGNTGLAAPSITTASATKRTVTVQGTMPAFASQSMTLELFANLTADSSGAGEGAVYLGKVTMTLSATGEFTAVFKGRLPRDYHWLSLTATDTGGNTSEFSVSKEI